MYLQLRTSKIQFTNICTLSSRIRAESMFKDRRHVYLQRQRKRERNKGITDIARVKSLYTRERLRVPDNREDSADRCLPGSNKKMHLTTGAVPVNRVWRKNIPLIRAEPPDWNWPG